MKILMTTDTIGGVWNFSLRLASALQAQGDHVSLATMGRALHPAQRLEIQDFAFQESEFPLEWMPDAWDGVDAAGQWLLRLEGELRPDVIHHNTLALAHLPFLAPTVVTLHSCVWSWFEAVKSAGVPPEWEEYRQRVRLSLAAADELVAPTRTMLEAAQRIYGLGDRGRVVPNSVKRSQIPPDWNAKEPLIFAAGRTWDEAKNLASLQEVAAALAWPVVIAGEGSSLGQLDRAEMDHWYSRAAIYAWPARYEPFGLSVLEAASHGCALVLGGIPSLRENWEGAALFVRDRASLSSVLQNLIADSGLRRDLSRRAYQRSLAFPVERTVQGYSAVYSQVLSGVLCAS